MKVRNQFNQSQFYMFDLSNTLANCCWCHFAHPTKFCVGDQLAPGSPYDARVLTSVLVAYSFSGAVTPSVTLLIVVYNFCIRQSSRSVAVIIWFMSFLIGLYVAIIAFSVTLCIKYLTGLKLVAVYACILIRRR